MATMYTWDPITGTYIQSDAGTYILDDTGAYILSANQTFSVSTDLPDYAPGSTATFTANVGVGDTVTFDVTDVAGTAVSGTDQPWTITDGGVGDLDGVANGVIQTSWAVGPDAAGEAFVLTATDISTGAIATTAFTDSPPPPEPTIFAYNDFHIDLALTAGLTTPTGDLILANGGSALVTLATSGTGNFGTFVEVQSSPTEDGYNTTNNTVLDGKNSDQFNTAIKLSDLQAVHADGSAATVLGSDTYYEFKLDLHQANSKPYISLDALQFWQSGTANLGPGTFVSGTNLDGSPSFSFNAGQATLAYDFGEKSILLNSLFTAGSGGGTDLVVLVKTDDFHAINGEYVYLYSAFGYQGGDWSANSTFEEWGALLKSGVTPPPPTPHAALSVDKETFCGDSPTDSHNISGSVVLSGKDIVWTYTVTATQDAVSGLVLTDDNGTPNNPLDDFHPTAVLGDGSTLADALHNIGDVNNNNIVDLGETWSFTKTGTAAIGAYSNEVFADGTSVQDGTAAIEGFDTSGYFGVNPTINVDKKTNGVDTGLNLLQGQKVTWTYDVTKGVDSNVDLTNVVVTDDQLGQLYLAGDTNHNGVLDLNLGENWIASGDLNNDGILETGETWHYVATGVAGATAYTNEVTVTADTYYNGQALSADACGNSLFATDTDSSDYTGHGQTLAGLTKGYWANHSWTGIDPSSTKLIFGDVDTDGVANDGAGTNSAEISHLDDLCLPIGVAQALANSSSTTDARIILASQLVAAQMNDYNDAKYDSTHGGLAPGGEAAPKGLIEEGVLWLTGNNFGTFPTNADSLANVDTNHNGVLDSGEYSVAKNGSISFTAPALSSSSSAWHAMQTVFDEAAVGYHPNTGNATVDALQLVVKADGEGLKNALAAYNHGLDGTTAGFVVSTDGTLIGWQDSLGGTVYDVHANTVNAFWGILEDQNQLSLLGVAGAHAIVGVGV